MGEWLIAIMVFAAIAVLGWSLYESLHPEEESDEDCAESLINMGLTKERVDEIIKQEQRK